MENEPWFKDGLRFECSQCGDCCSGAPGYVWVNKAEVHALAAQVGMAPEDFERSYVRKVGVRMSLGERENGDCVLFDGTTRKCTVYENRPRQCRTWPWWNSNVATPEAWKQTCQVCPGSGRGKLVPVEEIQKQLVVIKL